MYEQVFLALGGAFLPVGLILEVQQPKTVVLWLPFVIAGMVFYIVALQVAHRRQKEEQQERETARKELHKLLRRIYIKR